MRSSYAGFIEGFLHQYNDNFKQVRILRSENKSGYDSLVISSDMTAYRPRIEGALFARIKENGKRPFIAFRKKYKYWFDNKNIPAWNIESDKDFFRIDPNDFIRAVKDDEEGFAKLASQICVDAMSFPKFGCCSKYKQCSDAGKCIHEDLLYSSACEYRRNLEAGKIFYKTVD